MRFIHAADIHLDSPLLNLNQYDGAPVETFHNATRQAFENLVELAVEEKVDFVLIAGDLYDRECRDMNTPIALRRSLQELVREGIRVYIVQGNHDADSKVTKAFRLELPEGVHLFSTRKPETKLIEDLEVAIHGQGFPTGAVEDSLAAEYPGPKPGWFNIGLLHTNCGASPNHDDYAPSTVAELASKGYDYWALGHIHKRQTLHEADPWIVYPGNLQGRHVRESGEKGCVVVEVEDGRVSEVAFHRLAVIQWEMVAVDASDCRDGAAVVAAVSRAVSQRVQSLGNRLLAARVECTGVTEAHRDLRLHKAHFDREVREAVLSQLDDKVWIEKIRFHTSMPSSVEVAEEHDEALSELLGGLDDGDAVRAALAELRADLDALRTAMPTDPRQDAAIPDLDDEPTCERLLKDAQELIVARLTKQEGSP